MILFNSLVVSSRMLRPKLFINSIFSFLEVFVLFKSFVNFFAKSFESKIFSLIACLFNNSYISLTLAKHKVLFKERNKLENDFLRFCIENYHDSYSQRGQDLFALYVHSKSKNKNKICIEFGAGDGKHISNTFLLSKKKNLNLY